MVLMDTPYRLGALLKDVAEVLGPDRRVCVAFNLTLPDEAIYRGTAGDLSAAVAKKNIKGEFVLVVAGLPR
jgi:16S rRNA (cytidine1402-2'-O)-methyltransferase